MIRGQGTIAVREAEAGDGRTAEGVAVPYGVPVSGPTREYGSAAEVFERGAFADYVAQGGQIALLDTHEGVVIGMTDHLEETDAGLAYRGRLFTSQAARDYAERVAGGMRSVSIEFTPGRVRKGSGRVAHIGGAIAHGIAGTYRPAYQGATVAIREDSGMDTTTAENAAQGPSGAPVIEFDTARVEAIARGIARTELERAERALAEASALGRTVGVSPWAGVRTLGELLAGGFTRAKGDPYLNWRDLVATRAIANQVIADSPGVHTPGVQGEVRGIVGASRPAVTAWGTSDPGGSGLTVSWPYTTVDIKTLVGAQASEKTEITSVKVPILRGTASLGTYAGGSDLSYQAIRRSDPPYVEAYTRIMLAAWAYTTDNAFVDAVATAATGTGSLALAATIDEIRAAIFQASVNVEAVTGAPATFALAASDVFVYIGARLYSGPVFNQSGTASAASLDVAVSGIQIIHEPNLAAGLVLVSNRQTATWYEEGPFQAVAEDVTHLGQDRAIWSMGAAGVFLPAGIVKITKSPTVLLADEETARSRK
jgi:HK97 family phage prohead protease